MLVGAFGSVWTVGTWVEQMRAFARTCHQAPPDTAQLTRSASRWLRQCGTASFLAISIAQGASAQTNNNKPDWPTIVNQDVAAGYYSREVGDAQITDYNNAMERVRGSMDNAVAHANQDINMAMTGNPLLIGEVKSMIHDKDLGKVELAHQQAETIYNTLHLAVGFARNARDDISPVLQNLATEFDRIAKDRAAKLDANPNVPPKVKHDAESLASKTGDLSGFFDRRVSTDLEKIKMAESDLENHKAEVIAGIEKAITETIAKYGPDPSKWPKPDGQNTPSGTQNQPALPSAPQPSVDEPSDPAIAPAQPNISVPKPPPASDDTSIRVPTSDGQPDTSTNTDDVGVTGPAKKTPSTKPVPHGTIPSNAADPATQVNGAREPDTTPPPSDGRDPAVQVSSAARNPIQQPPKPKPTISEEDLINALKTPPKIDPAPVASPPSPNGDEATSPAGEGDGAFSPNKSTDLGLPNGAQSPSPSPGEGTPSGNAAAAAAAAAAAGAGVSTPGGNGTGAGKGSGEFKLPEGMIRPGRVGLSDQAPSDSPAVVAGVDGRNDTGNLTKSPDVIAQINETAAAMEAQLTQQVITSNPVLTLAGPTTIATLAPIYSNYVVAPGKGGSTVMLVTSTQIQTPTAVRSVPSTQVMVPSPHFNAPTAVMTVPSTQISVPSTQINVPSSQINVPSTQIFVPSTQIEMPSSVMTSLDLQPALCGR